MPTNHPPTKSPSPTPNHHHPNQPTNPQTPTPKTQQQNTAIGLPGKFSDNAFPLLAGQSRTVRYTARHLQQAPVDKDALLASLQIRSLYDTLPKGGAAAALPPSGGMSPPGAGAVQQKVHVVGGSGERCGGDKRLIGVWVWVWV